MPAQTTTTGAAFYSENDRAPDLVRTLVDGDGNPIDLTNAVAVTITIAHARYSHYYSPGIKIVDQASCTIDDAVNGVVRWQPGVGDLSPPGTFHYVFEIEWSGSRIETVPPNTYEPLIIRAKPGGQT